MEDGVCWPSPLPAIDEKDDWAWEDVLQVQVRGRRRGSSEMLEGLVVEMALLVVDGLAASMCWACWAIRREIIG